MEQDIRLTYSEFNAQATRNFFSLFNEFSAAAENLDRDSNENVFQLLRGKYLAMLKQKLDKLANLLINKSEKPETMGRLRINFSEQITYFQKEFTRKSESL
jgi:hypothetical protein